MLCLLFCSFQNILSNLIYTLIWRLNITKPLHSTMPAVYARNNLASSGVKKPESIWEAVLIIRFGTEAEDPPRGE